MCIAGCFLSGCLQFFAVYFSIMNPDSSSTEMSIKALQAQNAQFQELIMGLAQGQEELKALLLKKEKKKKRTVLFNSGRRFGNTLQNEEAGSSVAKTVPRGERLQVQ